MDDRGLRVALYGNVANTLFQLATCLRAQGVDAHLFVGATDDSTMRPESDDPSLADGYPEWIHQGRYNSGLARLMPWTSRLVKDLRGFDLVVVSYNGPMFAQFVGRPWCFLVTGGDLTTMPFPLRFRTWYPTCRKQLLMLLVAAWQRRGIRRATTIWTQGFSPFKSALRRLRIEPARISTRYLPVLLDTSVFSTAARETSVIDRSHVVGDADFVVFHPSRLMIDDTARLRATGQWKANDILIRGFGLFVASGAAKRPVLVMPLRTASPDVATAENLIASLGIENNVVWVRPDRPEGFPRHEVLSFYQWADVVADDFGIGWFGAVVLEGLASGKPVLSFVDEEVMSTMYPWHPIVSANTPDGVAHALEQLHRDAAYRQELGRRGRLWIEEYHSFESIVQRYMAAIKEAASIKS